MCRRNIRPSRLPCAPRSVAFPSPVSALKCPAAPGRFSGQTHTSDQSETVSPGCGPCMKTASDPYPNVCLRCHSVSHRRQIHSRQLTPLLVRCAPLRGTCVRNQLIDPDLLSHQEIPFENEALIEPANKTRRCFTHPEIPQPAIDVQRIQVMLHGRSQDQTPRI